MSYAGICSMERKLASSQPEGNRGLAIHYAQHVKDEIVELLRYDEALLVLKAAADAARDDVRSQVREHVAAGDKAEEQANLRNWCDGYVVGYIRKLIANHDGNHDAFVERVKAASVDGTVTKDGLR
jgi:hypothetical protein